LEFWIDSQLRKEIAFLRKLLINIINCTFYDNQHIQIISVEYSDLGYGKSPEVFISNTLISYQNMTEESVVMNFNEIKLYLDGPVVVHNVYCGTIIKTTMPIRIYRYFEISECSAMTAIIMEQIFIEEFSTVNFTANNIEVLTKYIFEDDPSEILTRMMLVPCIFQYTSKRGVLDDEFKTGKKLNYLILFNSNEIQHISLYKYSIIHCGWNKKTAFVHISPRYVNQKIIQFINDSLVTQKVLQKICTCDSKSHVEDCYKDELDPVYPGETVSFHFIITLVPIVFKRIFVRIEDGPEPACSTTNKSALIELQRNKCTEIKYTIQHTSGKECDLYLNGIPVNELGFSASPRFDIYYIQLNACPLGFIFSSKTGICQCDFLLMSSIASITVCDINSKTILRQSNSWISGFTKNNSHVYYVSQQCPFDYCLPQSSHLNPSTPDSQCQFNRSSVLCGHCRKGLSTVLGSSSCRHCSSVYLLIIIPIAIAGIVLVPLLFIFNLTVTNGDINAILFYANIIGINR